MAYNCTNSVEWWLLHLIITRECLQSLNGDLDARVILEIFGRRRILLHHSPASAWRNLRILLRLSEPPTYLCLCLLFLDGPWSKIFHYVSGMNVTLLWFWSCLTRAFWVNVFAYCTNEISTLAECLKSYLFYYFIILYP
jgi:hypothetical protein